MGKRIRHTLITLTLAATICGEAYSQLNEQIEVEGTYLPEIIPADRLHVFPDSRRDRENPAVLEYETDGVTADYGVLLYTMPATAWRGTKEFSTYKGYIEGGIGSWLNSTLSIGYRIIDNSTDLLGIRFQHNSTSLWKAENTLNKQYRYNEALGLYFNHVFYGKGRFDAAIDWRPGFFNYYGISSQRNTLIGTTQDDKSPCQDLEEVALQIGWKPLLHAERSWDYGIGAMVRYIGFKNFAVPFSEKSKGDKETDIRISGNVSFPWGEKSSWNIDAKAEILLYGGGKDDPYSNLPGYSKFILPERPENYGLITINPGWHLQTGKADIKIGAVLDFAMNAGPDGNKYPIFHIAPDVKINLRSGYFGGYLTFTGGSRLNTLETGMQHDYYMMPTLATTRPTYIPLDFSIGGEIGSFGGFTAGLQFQYRFMRNLPLGGWYMYWLNNGNVMAESMIAEGHNGIPLYCLDTSGINLQGMSLRLKLSYSPATWLAINAEGNWQPQDGKKGYFNGYDRPEFTATASVEGRPISPLMLRLGYDYRGNRHIYTSYIDNPGGLLDVKPALAGMHLPDLSLLNFAASWDFTPSLAVWLQIDNILGRHTMLLPSQPQQGITVLAGVKWLF